MSDFLKVNFAALGDAHTDLGRGVDTLTSKLKDLDSQARPLVATWDGAAQQAYLSHQAAWTKSALELTDVLQNIRKELEKSLLEYRETEARNASRFNK